MTLDNDTRVPGVTPQFGIYISVCVIQLQGFIARTR